jgi:hypothetical protein
MIAAAIVAMSLGGAFRVIADGASRDRALDARREALMVAQSRLDAVGSEIPLRSGQSAGMDGTMIWRVTVTPYEDGFGSGGAEALWKVAVSVRTSAERRALVQLDTLRLGPQA